jgi:hypothetical protein
VGFDPKTDHFDAQGRLGGELQAAGVQPELHGWDHQLVGRLAHTARLRPRLHQARPPEHLCPVL